MASYELSRSMGFDLSLRPSSGTPARRRRLDSRPSSRRSFDEHYFTINDRPEFGDAAPTDVRLRPGGQLGGPQGRSLPRRRRTTACGRIDNGLTFHSEFKVRTVCWDFAGEPLPIDVGAALAELLDRGLSRELSELLDADEREAVLRRTRALLSEGHFPHDSTGRRYPWPLV